MLLEEMKCIEIILKNMLNKNNLESDIAMHFKSHEEFIEHKLNLINLIAIEDILANLNETPSFSLERFLYNGTIPEKYDEPTEIPNITCKYNVETFYEKLFTALKKQNYTFDISNNLCIKTDDLKVTIPQIWLYRLAEGLKQPTYKRVFFYSKNKPKQIQNKEELLNYLRKVKTFIVELKGCDMLHVNKELEYIKEHITAYFKDKEEVKVQDIMSLFQLLISSKYQSKLKKYRLKEEYWLMSKVEQNSDNFYSKPINAQEEILNNWIIKNINAKTHASKETAKYLLIDGSNPQNTSKIAELNQEEIVIGLFKIYMNILFFLKQDLSYISLSNFKLKAYITPENQQASTAIEPLFKEKINAVTEEAIKIIEELKQLDITRDFDAITKKRAQYEQSINYLDQNKSGHKIENSIEDIAFDNDLIMSLIEQSIKNGRLYLNKNELNIELYNDSIPEPIFKTTITINALMQFIEEMNVNLDEYGVPREKRI